MSVQADVDDTTRDMLAGVAIGDLKVLDEELMLALGLALPDESPLDARSAMR